MKLLTKFFACFLLLSTLSIAFSTTASAQASSISGVVLDAEGLPVVGAVIVEQGTSNGVTADFDGKFTIKVPAGASLEISCLGYLTQIATAVNGMSVVLAQDNLSLEETVVVGYGSQRVATVTGSVSQVKGDKLNTAPVGNTTHTLAGQLPGLISKQTSGLPGQDDASLQIRNFGAPLVIVDGIEGSIASLDPAQIESISILKDGSGSIYGARAGNGVILVTTKTGSNQKATVTINSSVTMNSNVVTTLPADSYQRAQLDNDKYLNKGGDPSRVTYTEEELELYKTGGNPDYLNNSWYEAVMRKFAPQQNHNISVQGGTDRTSYYGYYGFNRQTLQFKAEDPGHYDKHNFQANFSTKVYDRMRIGMNLQYTMTDKDYPSGFDLYQDGTNFWSAIYSADPRYAQEIPGHPELLAWANQQGGTPKWGVDITKSGYYRNKTNNMKVIGFAEYSSKFVQGLKAKANVIFTFNNSELKWMNKRGIFYTYEPSTELISKAGASVSPSYLRMDHSSGQNLVQQYSLDYNRDFNGHHVSALAMFESTISHSMGFYARRTDFQTTIIEELPAGDPKTATDTSWSSDYGRTSFIGRLNYNYRDKYMAEFIIRADASSRFDKGYKWGYFPSFSLGWNIAKEEFLKSTVVDNLKIRASYGMSGRDDVANFNYLTGYEQDHPYVFGDAIVMGVASTGLANPLLSWENMTIYNIGIDYSFFKRKLYGEVDLFQRDRKGIPGYRSSSLPNTLGATLPQENLNSRRARGFEFRAGSTGQYGDFMYDVSANISWSREKWSYYDQTPETDPDRARLYTKTGTWVDRQMGYGAERLFQTQEEVVNWECTVDDLNHDSATIGPGDIKPKDQNGDGVLNWKDQVEIGKGAMPHWMYGLNLSLAWKGIDLSMLFQGAFGYTMSIGYDDATSSYCERYFDIRRRTGADVMVPRPNGSALNWWTTSFTYRDVAYLRLKNASLGYSLPANVCKKIGMSKVRIYVAGMNLFTVSTVDKYGVDPENGGTVGYSYPQQRTMSLGLNITF
ncbi:MAG: TonB-dependent receptor [Bacteroidales bacterium]|nr:TonB-dependent receptor [Bacteroidales bacterium]